MKKQNRSLHAAALLAAFSALPLAHAATLTYDSGAGGGLQAGNGAWDFNTTANWTTDGGASRVNWTNNADTAHFQLQGTAGTVTIGASVGAGGLIFSGSTGGTSNVWTLGGTDSLQLGSGGLSNQISDGVLLVNSPLALTASQTWTSTRLGNNNTTAGVRVGAISSASGTTNLTFDGLGLSNASSSGGSQARIVFELGGANTFTGTTTVTGGAALRLSYVTDASSKLDDASALILKGGSIVLSGGSNVTETVASTTIDSGANTIYAGANGAGGTTNKIALGALTHNVSGTLDVTNAVAGIATTTTTNTNGIIGGWATVGGNRFATGSTNGSAANIASTAGSTQNTYASFAAATNTIISAAVSGTGDKTVNTLRVASGGSLSLASGGTLTIASGGIIGDSGTSISGGNLTSGTNALYVHTPSALTIGSAIVNGASAISLVKAGANTLTLTGTNTYTGATYVNSGTLALNGGSLANGNVFVRGAASFTMNSTSSITFNVNGTGAGQFDVFSQDAGGAVTLDGALSLKFGDTFASGASFDLFDLASGSADGFTSISVSGSYVGTLTENSGVWTGVVGGQNFTFTESSGLLQIAASAVPEPSTFAALAGLAGLGMAASRRRRRV